MTGLVTDRSASPYHSDHSPDKNYHRVLFKPSVAVQNRELHEIQEIMQEQIERFGDHIFRRGTIVDGCNFNFFNVYPYAKILDSDIESVAVDPASYVGYFAKNSSNLHAYIVNSYDGFEASAPDLKTLYFKYINSGDSNETNAFSQGDLLTIFDSNNAIYGISVDNGGLGFANSDTVVITPALAVNVSTGSFANGDYLVDEENGANLQIIEVDEISLATKSQVLLKVAPRQVDLANGSANSAAWTLVQGAAVKDAANSVAAVIENIYGTSASATIETNAAGRVLEIEMVNRGDGYLHTPHASIRSIDNSVGMVSLDITPKNFVGKVYISSDEGSVGNGTAFGVGEGIIYQKGHFIKTAQQTIIVEKYSQSPNNVAVGFETQETIITAFQDNDLYDNVISAENPNENAPGADRLKLTPTLKLLDKQNADLDDEFFTLVEWNEGNPYKQNQLSFYSKLGDELSGRMFDHAGNFVVDTFQVTTASIANSALEGKYYTAVVDPGQAYISGYKVQTKRNYNINILKGLDTKVIEQKISLNYGNYIRINEVGGIFQFSTGDQVTFYDTAKEFVSNVTSASTGNCTPVGTAMGTARIRSLTLENGIAGSADAIFRLHLFDIRLLPGRTFKRIRSVAYGTNAGIADAVLELDPSTSISGAVLKDTTNNKLIWKAGVESLKNSNNTSYTYRTIDQTTSVSNTGILTKTIAASPNEFYPYTGSLSDAQLKELYVVPIANSLIAYANATGTVATVTSSNVINGTTTTFISDFAAGDYVQLYSNALNSDVLQVISVNSNTKMRLSANASFANATAKIFRVFPKNVPVPFGSRSGLSANVDANSNILSINFGMTLDFAGTSNTALAVNIERTGVTATSRSSVRRRFVQINLSTHTAGVAGPWCLGISDVMRLRNVYVDVIASISTSSPNFTSEFYVDHNQNANFRDLSYLYLNSRHNTSLDATKMLLIEFDYFDSSGTGYFDTTSYLGTANTAQIQALDSLPLSNLTTQASSWEVPEVYTHDDKYYDLYNSVDLRPSAEATAAPNTAFASAPTNPSATLSFGNTANPSNDRKFPLPDSLMTTTVEHYLGRIDHIVISAKSGHIFVNSGTPAADPRKRFEPNHPKDALKLQVIHVPPYPNITKNPSIIVGELISTRISNERAMQLRLSTRKVSEYLSTSEMQLSQPMVYTMEDIGNLERRIADLEYYVQLSILETDIVNRTIPSSIDGTLNRFKFGFIADDFSTSLYSDISNPQYAASIESVGDFTYGAYQLPNQNLADAHESGNPENKSVPGTGSISKRKTNKLVPPKFNWGIKHFTWNSDYIDSLILVQENATDSPVECEIGILTPAANNRGYYTTSSQYYNTAVRTDYLLFGTDPATATLYFYNFTGHDKIEVYHANNLIASTNNTSTAISTLTAADKQFLSTNTIAKDFYSGGNANVNAEFTRSVSNLDFVNNAGKLTFFYNPITDAGNRAGRDLIIGNEYRSSREVQIKVTKSASSTRWTYLLDYPLNDDLSDITVNPCTPPAVTAYNGTMRVDLQAQWSCSKQFTSSAFWHDNIYCACTGLKPNTIHHFYLDGVFEQDDVHPFGKARGQPLITDQFGKLNFIFRMDETWFNKIKGPDGQYIFIGAGNIGAGGAVHIATFGSTGYTLFEVRALDSSASTLVANRAPRSLLK